MGSALVRRSHAGTGILAAAVLVAVTTLAWISVVEDARTMEPGMNGGAWSLANVPGYIAAWTVMMTAMMLPSAAPLVLVYWRASRVSFAATLLCAGYLAVWASVGTLAWVVDGVGMGIPGRPLAAAVLIVAGLYQLTRLKDVCLRACRDPASFLVERWRGGRLGALRLGLAHGVYCLGCCWALMVVLVAAGGMGLWWVAGLALVVAAEKLLPIGVTARHALAVVFIGLGVACAAVPGLVASLRI